MSANDFANKRNDIQDAIYCMKVTADQAVCEECDHHPGCDHTTQEDMAKVAIYALEKRIPMKPNKDDKQTMRYTTVYVCPSCGGIFSGTVNQYCYHCGQALDWSESGK